MPTIAESTGESESAAPEGNGTAATNDTGLHLSIPPPAGTSQSASAPLAEPPTVTHENGVWTAKAFMSFLLSPENAAFQDEKMDMTHPMSEYFISSSHNTYLVGHQLVGESTIEGYCRALLHGCRSVEGKWEPFNFAKQKSLTSRRSQWMCTTAKLSLSSITGRH